ncbi:MAG: choice-of-anchor tandem repeat GloVer-containing protein, partial [Candidatus Cybelea sp.]
FSGLANVGGTLYGTTNSGGANCRSGSSGCGTVFAITTSGKETVLHSFGSSGDGQYPVGGLVNVNGELYGTTLNGPHDFCGEAGCGTVFSITPSGKESVLHKFGGSADGANPLAGLINVNGTLYGTTVSGGAQDRGTVFAITTSGKEAVLYSFGTSSEDGNYPYAGLLNVKGTLYGTTAYGGKQCSKKHGCGTVFSVTTSGSETVLYRFKGHSDGRKDGAHPEAGVVNLNDTLYGTTYGGGASDVGTVFSLSP